jgi:peptide chain release factor 1
MIPQAKLDKLIERYKTVEAELSRDQGAEAFVRYSKEHAELTPVATAAQRLAGVRTEIESLEAMLRDSESLDREMISLTEEELSLLKDQLPHLEREVQLLLLPKDSADERSVILEIRAGTGGDEASLFAADLFNMYQRYAEGRRWKVEILSMSESGVGGIKEVIASVTGKGVFARLKFESGVHRVQRVPSTETQGRIHTSAATVAVLPEPEDVDIVIEDKDLRIDVFRSSGPGGQSVNTTDSAVRITHLPSGLVVSQQDEKSQHKNKAKGLKVLRARLFEMEREKQDKARAAARKGMVGSGDRSERIRTYNFPQGRVTDHRINLTLYKLDRVMLGEIDELVDGLTSEDQAARLSAMDETA